MTRYPSGTAVASPLPSVVCWCALVAFLSALLAALHHTAVQKSQLVDVFAVVTPDTIKKIQLIELVDHHPEWVSGYMVMMLAMLAFSSWRRHPIWTSWACFVLLAAPCLIYLSVCGQVVGKILSIDGPA